jgi:L-lactate dehydrogenase complex protein LldG
VSEPREQILAAIRKALGRDQLDRAGRDAVDRRLGRPHANVVPMRGQLDGPGKVALFIAEAERVNATTRRLSDWPGVPHAIAAYLKSANLPAHLKVAPDPALDAIPWPKEPLLHIARGRAEDGDAVSVTGAFAGIAETGTLMLLSGPDSPTTLNFLPDTHIVVMPAAGIVGTYEDAWERLRSRCGGAMPRTINWITGPSRTADIEQTLLLGAHGPRRLHILLVDAETS